jgi:SAM-dependent methyltransferase
MLLYNELAEYYFAIEANHRDIHNDISLIRTLLRGRDMPKLLDLGCGTGEHMDKLSRHGAACMGIDSSESMLAVARRRYPEAGTFLRGDFRTFDFYNEFDLIISLFGTFNYMVEDADIEKALWNTWRAMKPDGMGLFEVWNSVPVERIREKGIGPVSKTRYNGVLIDRERGFTMLPGAGRTLVEVNYIYTIHDHDGTRTQIDQHIMRTFTMDEMNRFLGENGFRVRDIYSSFIRENYQEHSNRMVILFDKSA